ncbi:MAG: hypothetical protein WBD22_07905 [Pyrinomonadaceae bacterium]
MSSIIFVDTDNSNPKKKLYMAAKAGGSAAKAELAMKTAVETVINKTPGFTTTKTEKSKGYVLTLNVASIDGSGKEKKCRLDGAIARYPTELLITKGLTGGAKADTADAIVDAISAIAEALTIKALPFMRADFVDQNE